MICLAAQTSNWVTLTALPKVDLSPLTAPQKQTALKIMREEECPCGCGRKIAQCRVEDTQCTVSRGAAAKIVKSVQEGKSQAQIKAMLAASAGGKQVLDDAITLNISGAPVKGPAAAPLTLVEFSDFQCPYCSQAVLELEAIQKAFPKDVRLVFKQFPLAQIHPNATLAAQAAIAAHAQGKFWPLHDRMFANHTKLTRDNLLNWAKEIGCDMPRFTADLDSAKTRQQVARDLDEGETAGVEGTPSIYVNGKHYNGSLALQPFGDVLRQELKTARAGHP